MRGFQIIDLLMPTKLGPGLYQLCLDRCRLEVNVNPMINDLSDIKHSVLDVVVPLGTDVDLLHLLPWADRLMRDMGVVPKDFRFGEYGTAFSPELRKHVLDHNVKVSIWYEIAPSEVATPQKTAEAA